jgi:hypothetical protein
MVERNIYSGDAIYQRLDFDEKEWYVDIRRKLKKK